MGSSLRWMPGDWPSCRLPVETSDSRSFSSSSFPKISTADTRTEKRVPVFSLRSLMSLKSQEMAQGTMPRLCVLLSLPIMVYVLPYGAGKERRGLRNLSKTAATCYKSVHAVAVAVFNNH